jgi:glycine C-acetyltransferase
MVQKSRPQLFSNALPPATAAAATKAIDILTRDNSRIEKLRENVHVIREGLKGRGFETVDAPSAITPILLGETAKAIAASKRLLELGVFVIGFGYPVVPEGTARLRVQISAAHRKEHLDRALDAFSKL